MDEIKVRLIEYGSEDYKAELEMRNEILRKPLGLSIYDEDLGQEKPYFHIGAFENGKLVGTLLFIDRGEGVCQMRQVAVCEGMRRRGIGRKMVLFGENLMKEKGFSKIVLEARKVALEFYLSLGYRTAGPEELRLGIPHYEMEKGI